MPSAPSWMLFLQPNVPVKNCYCHDPPSLSCFSPYTHNMFEINIFPFFSVSLRVKRKGCFLCEAQCVFVSKKDKTHQYKPFYKAQSLQLYTH